MTHAETFAEHRALIFSIAYRMLGTVADAEDTVQEAYVRWQRAPIDAVASARAYLVTVVTRLCVDQLKAARHRVEETRADGLPDLVSSEADDPFASSALADSLSIAFLVVLQALSPTERAVLLLHDVFDFEHAAIAATTATVVLRIRSFLSGSALFQASVTPP